MPEAAEALMEEREFFEEHFEEYKERYPGRHLLMGSWASRSERGSCGLNRECMNLPFRTPSEE